jgi:hypothetical protein
MLNPSKPRYILSNPTLSDKILCTKIVRGESLLRRLLSKFIVVVGIGGLILTIGCTTPPVPQPIPLTVAFVPATPTLTQVVTPTYSASTITPSAIQPITSTLAMPSLTPSSTPTAYSFPPLNVQAPQPPISATRSTAYLIGTTPDTNVAQAQARLLAQGLRFYLNVISPESTGIEQEIYQDLIRRDLRATTGPDEGISTSALPCAPNCDFVPIHAVNEISVESWVNVLRHEQRHMVQAANNPNLAHDFRAANGVFTTYAAFEEVCADDGIYVGEPLYHTSERMSKLKMVLGAGNALTLQEACEGDKAAYENIVRAYESRLGGVGSFAQLFPPYR